VVDSSVLFSEYLDLLQKKGLALGDSVLASGKIIIKPLIMNQGTTFLGLLPIALELGEGTELQSPMAITVMGGIFVSALLSLFLIPTLIYHLRKGSGHGNL
jgi:multidrug efflux pump subunit AcrB